MRIARRACIIPVWDIQWCHMTATGTDSPIAQIAARVRHGVFFMKFHPYKLAGAAIAPELKGKVVQIHVAESYEDFTSLTETGDPNRCLALANQQFILNEERAAKAVAESKEVTDMIAAGNVDGAFALIQDAATNYRDGGRKAAVPNETKTKAAQVDGAKAKLAAMTPEQRAKKIAALKELGFDFGL